ncbi:MAG: hypothetical protein ACOC0B_01900, partial [bacterium]
DYAWSRREARLPAGLSDVRPQGSDARPQGSDVRPQGASLHPQGASLRLHSDIVRNEPWERQFDARVDGESRGQFLVSAVYETLDQQVVFRTLRDALIAILAFALLVLVVLIGSLRTEGQHTSRGSPEPALAGNTPDSPGTRPSTEQTGIQSQSRPEPSAERRPNAGEESQDRNETRRHTVSGKSESTPADSGSEAYTGPDTPPPLVSPNSGLSFENHLPRRLSLELERAAENNLDLSLLIIRITDAEGTPVTPRLLGTLILEQFPFEDLTFEYSPAGACIILTGIDLDTALRKAERLRAVLRRHELGSYRVRAGASSRNGRLVESDRLIREAHEAFGRSDAQSFAVGFRPDPDRYRSYIASKTEGTR